MCIRDSLESRHEAILGQWLPRGDQPRGKLVARSLPLNSVCLLYTSDAADERSSVDLGGRRIIKKKKNTTIHGTHVSKQADKSISASKQRNNHHKSRETSKKE